MRASIEELNKAHDKTHFNSNYSENRCYQHNMDFKYILLN